MWTLEDARYKVFFLAQTDDSEQFSKLFFCFSEKVQVIFDNCKKFGPMCPNSLSGLECKTGARDFRFSPVYISSPSKVAR